MDRAQFRDWWADFGAAFPWAPEFVEKGGDARRTLEHWEGVLATVSLRDALEITRRMLAGTMPEPEIVNRASTPRHIRKLAFDLHPVVPEWRQAQLRDGSGGIVDSDPVMRAALRSLSVAIAETDPVSAEATLEEYFPGTKGCGAAYVDGFGRLRFRGPWGSR